MFKEKFERATPIVIDSALKALKCWKRRGTRCFYPVFSITYLRMTRLTILHGKVSTNTGISRQSRVLFAPST